MLLTAPGSVNIFIYYVSSVQPLGTFISELGLLVGSIIYVQSSGIE